MNHEPEKIDCVSSFTSFYYRARAPNAQNRRCSWRQDKFTDSRILFIAWFSGIESNQTSAIGHDEDIFHARIAEHLSRVWKALRYPSKSSVLIQISRYHEPEEIARKKRNRNEITHIKMKFLLVLVVASALGLVGTLSPQTKTFNFSFQLRLHFRSNCD